MSPTRLPRRFFQHAEEILAASLLLLLCVTVILQVFSRLVLGKPYVWTEEVARLLFIWAAFAGAAAALKQNRHFAIDLLVAGLASEKSAWARKSVVWLQRFVALLVVTLLLILTWYGFVHVWRVRDMSTDILEISLGWTYLPLPLSCLAMALRSFPAVFFPPRLSVATADLEPE